MAGGGKGGKKQSTTMRLDPATERFVGENREIASGLADQIFTRPESFFGGPNYQMLQSLDALGGAQGQAGALANLGLGAGGAGISRFLQGGLGQLPGITQAIAGPQIQGLMPLFGQEQDLARVRSDQQATAAGAFGGVRGEMAAEEAARQRAMGQQAQIGQLLGGAAGQGLGFIGQQQGQNLGLAGLGLTNLGRGASLGGQFAGQGFGMGGSLLGIENQQRQEDLFRAQQGMGLRTGAIGPYGQNTAGTQPSNKFGSAAGGALTGFGIGGPIGAGIGGLGGLLFG